MSTDKLAEANLQRNRKVAEKLAESISGYIGTDDGGGYAASVVRTLANQIENALNTVSSAPRVPDAPQVSDTLKEWKRRSEELMSHDAGIEGACWERALTYDTCVEEIEAAFMGREAQQVSADELIEEVEGQPNLSRFLAAVKYLQSHGYSDWDGTANGQEITLTGAANMMRQYLDDTLRTRSLAPVLGNCPRCGSARTLVLGHCHQCAGNWPITEATIVENTLAPETCPLPEKWRNQSSERHWESAYAVGRSDQREVCADELESWLASPLRGKEQSDGARR